MRNAAAVILFYSYLTASPLVCNHSVFFSYPCYSPARSTRASLSSERLRAWRRKGSAIPSHDQQNGDSAGTSPAATGTSGTGPRYERLPFSAFFFFLSLFTFFSLVII